MQAALHKPSDGQGKVIPPFLLGTAFLCLHYAQFHGGVITAYILKVAHGIGIGHKLCHSRFYGQAGHKNDEFVDAIALMEFKDGLRIDIRLSGAGLHLDVEVEVRASLMQFPIGGVYGICLLYLLYMLIGFLYPIVHHRALVARRLRQERNVPEYVANGIDGCLLVRKSFL